MKSRELMIGDWVHVKLIRTPIQVEGNFNGRVTLIDDLNSQIGVGNKWAFDCDEIEPIPLTPEILEKNFQKDPDYIDTYWRPDCRKFCFTKENDDWYFAFRYKGGHICIAECNYVHELQHALKLCGIEKEIVI